MFVLYRRFGGKYYFAQRSNSAYVLVDWFRAHYASAVFVRENERILHCFLNRHRRDVQQNGDCVIVRQ